METYYFNTSGRYIRIKRRDVAFEIKRSFGIRLIEHLINFKDRYLSYAEIMQWRGDWILYPKILNRPSVTNGRKWDEHYKPYSYSDKLTLQDCYNSLNRLVEKIAQAESYGDYGQVKQLLIEKEHIISYVRSVMNKSTMQIHYFKGEMQKSKQNYQKGIHSAVKEIRTFDEELGKHLTKSIKKNRGIGYFPEGDIDIILN